ncbi:hypothetical protein MF672_001920 [Actinomadura sp. ATCC 31491]|uniref:Lipoprotein n=1 Tax=Actinomadura luzonensis TaxID=2805427 RepID=A0ABT0FKU2_9ACTN|nr:hypothetical protein [Actinomadura luzonensis]MCK2212563.1 hypothetical protein [Actinomadura luzonensis]
MRTRRYAATTALLCVAAVTACAAGHGLPTLDEATRRLTTDADRLLGTPGLRPGGLHRSGPQQIEDTTCVPGEVRGFLQVEAERVDASSGLQEELQAMGYDKVADDLDLRDDTQDVSVLRNPETWLTFELTVVHGERPGVRLVGKTTCYAATGRPASPDHDQGVDNASVGASREARTAG